MGSDNISNEMAAISDRLIHARRSAIALPSFPGTLPETLEAAYAVQDYSIKAWGDHVAGWKVGGVPAAYLDRFTDKRLVGPIFQNNMVHAKAGDITEFAVLPGFAAVEGEFVFSIGETPADDKLHIGVEVASSPLQAINDMGPVAVICDFGNNGGLIVGPEIPNWQSLNPQEFDVQTQIDGEIVGTKTISDFPGDGLLALAFMRQHAQKYGVELPVGTFVSSGAITGVHETYSGCSSVVSFGPFGSINIALVPAKAAQ